MSKFRQSYYIARDNAYAFTTLHNRLHTKSIHDTVFNKILKNNIGYFVIHVSSVWTMLFAFI